MTATLAATEAPMALATAAGASSWGERRAAWMSAMDWWGGPAPLSLRRLLSLPPPGVVVAVGAHHVGEHLDITGVGLGPTRR